MDIKQPLPGTSFAKLQARIKKDLNIDLVNFTRLYPGYWQRSQGAFVWSAMELTNGVLSAWDYGSTQSVKELLSAKRLDTTVTGNEIVGEEK